MAPHFVSCTSCSRHFNTDFKEGFICCFCTALDKCTSDIDRQVLDVRVSRSLAPTADFSPEVRPMPDLWQLLQAWQA